MQSLKLDTSVWSNEIVQVRSLKREKMGVGERWKQNVPKRPWAQLGDRIGRSGDSSSHP